MLVAKGSAHIMKYVIIIPDGAADLPIDDLEGKTPLEAAHTPNTDRLAIKREIAASCPSRKSSKPNRCLSCARRSGIRLICV